MGMIYKRGKVYWIKYYRNGKPYRESTRSQKEADAKRLLKKREGDLERGIVRLEPGETKNDEGRTVYLDEELKEIFALQWKARKKSKTLLPYVFLNKDGTDRIKRFDKEWKTACQEARIGVRIFHDLRRTAVRNMVRSGIPERVAMMISGHKTRSVFDKKHTYRPKWAQIWAQSEKLAQKKR